MGQGRTEGQLWKPWDWGGDVSRVLDTEDILLNLAGGQLGPVLTLMIREYTGVMQGGKGVAEERTEVKGEGPVCGKEKVEAGLRRSKQMRRWFQ